MSHLGKHLRRRKAAPAANYRALGRHPGRMPDLGPVDGDFELEVANRPQPPPPRCAVKWHRIPSRGSGPEQHARDN